MLRAAARSSAAALLHRPHKFKLRWSSSRPPSSDSTPPHDANESPASSSMPENSPSAQHRGPQPSFPRPSGLEMDDLKARLVNMSDRAAIAMRTKADDFTETTKATFSQLGAQLNKVTGYEDIEALKRQVVDQEARINATRQAARDAKVLYEQAVMKRSNSQREVNELLQRKSMWTDADVGRFTALVREDHMLEQEEARSRATVEHAEAAQEKEFSELMRAILGRYHEEQVWSDKIRSASTYGQLAALALNLLVFLMATIIVEPWKRKRLAQTFEKKSEALSTETKQLIEAEISEVKLELQEQVRLLTVLAETALQAQQKAVEDVGATSYVPILADLQTSFWDRAILSGVAAGALTATIISWLLNM